MRPSRFILALAFTTTSMLCSSALAIAKASDHATTARVATVPDDKQPDDNAPWRRVLTGGDAKRVAELEQRIEELRRAAKHAEAKPAAQKVLEIRSRVQGADHWQTGDARRLVHALGQIAKLPSEVQAELAEAVRLQEDAFRLAAQRNFADAITKQEQAIEVFQRHLSDEDGELAGATEALGAWLTQMGKHREGEPLLRKALAIRRRVLGDDHPDTATNYRNLATNLAAQDRHAEPEELVRNALAIFRRLLSEDHRYTWDACRQLASVLGEQGKYPEAEPLFRDALAMARRQFGETDLETTRSYDDLALNLNELARYAEAESLFRKALDLRLARKNDEAIGTSLHNLALNLYLQRKHTEADRLYRQALEIDLRSALILAQDQLPDASERVSAGQFVFDGRYTADQILRTWKLEAELVTLSGSAERR